MATILIIDPRPAVQMLLEHVFLDQGYTIVGPPDVVATCQSVAARFWMRKGVPVAIYEWDEMIDLNELLALVGEFLVSS